MRAGLSVKSYGKPGRGCDGVEWGEECEAASRARTGLTRIVDCN